MQSYKTCQSSGDKKDKDNKTVVKTNCCQQWCRWQLQIRQKTTVHLEPSMQMMWNSTDSWEAKYSQLLYLHVWTNLHTPVNFFFSISSLLLDFCCQLTSWLSHRENSHHSRWQVHPRLSPFSLTGGRYNMTRKKKKCTEFESQLMDLFLLNCGIVSGMWGISEVTQNLSGSFKLF